MLRLPDRVFERLAAAIARLADDPRPPGSEKLRARGPAWRLRVGDYRVGYTIFDPDKLISVDAVDRRTTTTYRKR